MCKCFYMLARDAYWKYILQMTHAHLDCLFSMLTFNKRRPWRNLYALSHRLHLLSLISNLFAMLCRVLAVNIQLMTQISKLYDHENVYFISNMVCILMFGISFCRASPPHQKGASSSATTHNQQCK